MVSGPVSGSVEVGTGGQQGDKTKPKREVGDGGLWVGRMRGGRVGLKGCGENGLYGSVFAQLSGSR